MLPIPTHPTAVIVVGGPTASGKSALALATARRLAEAGRGAVVINADSMQVYRELAVLTARPTPDDAAVCPHRLYGVLPAAEACSVGWWLGTVTAEIRAAWEAGQVPLVVGGTGLYLRALMQGIATIPPVPAAARAEAEHLHRTLGGGAFHQRLAAVDAELAARLHPGDPQRMVRGYAVWLATGTPLSHWQSRPATMPLPEAQFLWHLHTLPRPELYARCDARVAQMVAQGAVEEVTRLLAHNLPPSLPAMRAVGVPELRAYLHGEQTLDTAMDRMRQSTRQYAKRQLTWFRNQRMGALQQ